MKRAITIIAASLALPLPALAVLVANGASVGVSLRSCIAGQTACDGVDLDAIELAGGGLPGDTTAQSSVTQAGIGTATAKASLSGTIRAPLLQAFATGAVGYRANTTSIALQRYTYTGSAPAERTFGATLTYSQSLSGVYPQFTTGGGIYGAIDLFTLPVPMIDAGMTGDSYFLALFDVSTLPGYASLGYQEVTDPASASNGLATLEVKVTLRPDEQVWVWTLLQTPAPNGSTVDAFHTMVTSWDNPANLVPAPEPATWAELAIGLTALAGLHRRGARHA